MTNKFYFPVKIFFGAGSFDELPAVVKDISDSVLVVTGKKSLRESGYLDRLLKGLSALGIRYFIHENVPSDPPVEEIDRVSGEQRKNAFGLVLAIGGGSVIDFGKCLALMKNYKGRSVWNFVNLPGRQAKQITHKVLPVVAVPTTAGTGSEATPFAVLSNKRDNLKKGIGDLSLYPSAAVIDPELTLNLSREHTLCTGLDAFCQSLESYIGIRNSPLTEVFCINSMRLVMKNLPRALDNPSDLEARSGLSIAATHSGAAIGQTDTGLAHAIGQAISTFFPLPHGLAVALVTPMVIRFNAHSIEEKLKTVTSYIKRLSHGESISDFFRSLGLKFGLSNYGISMTDLDAISESAMQIGSIRTNLLPVDKNAIKNILKESIAN